MRERQIEQFEALFERASIPVLDIPPLTLARISVVLAGTDLADSIVRLGAYLADRFEAAVQVHFADGVGRSEASTRAEPYGFALPGSGFADTPQLMDQVNTFDPQLVLVPVPADALRRAVDVDPLVEGVRPPILLVHQPIIEPANLLRRVLHVLTGNFQQTENFAHSFRLVEADGEILLLHVIRRDEIDDVREALSLSSEMESKQQQELLNEMARVGERYLKGVVAGARRLPCHVSYRIQVGDVREIVQTELAGGSYGLLVVGAESRRSHVAAEVYQLMHTVMDTAVLAL